MRFGWLRTPAWGELSCFEVTRQKTAKHCSHGSARFIAFPSRADLRCALRKHTSQLLRAGHLIWVSAFDPIFDCRMRVILDDQPGWDR